MQHTRCRLKPLDHFDAAHFADKFVNFLFTQSFFDLVFREWRGAHRLVSRSCEGAESSAQPD